MFEIIGILATIYVVVGILVTIYVSFINLFGYRDDLEIAFEDRDWETLTFTLIATTLLWPVGIWDLIKD